MMLAGAAFCGPWVAAQAGQPVIVIENHAGSLPALASSEVRRYFYLRTGEWLGLKGKIPASGDAVVIARKDSPLLRDFAEADTGASQLKAQEYRVKSLSHGSRRLVLIIGGDDLGTLYGAYRFAETLGVRFYLHGDVIPDTRRAAVLPEVDEVGRPLFNVRGINPWGWHPYGMDAWSADDYKAVIAQLAKLRMNFMGIHCYPERHPQAEPTVWHGLMGDFDAAGRVTRSYPSRYFNTLVGGAPWGDYLSKKTSDYSFGGALLFDDEAWAPDVLRGFCPHPVTAADCNEVFNRTGAQFQDAFGFARQLGVKTCIGTEAPLTIPASVAERSRDVRAVYEGTFRRIMASHPLDYYWLWTPEGWRVEGTPVQYQATVADLKLAYEALTNVGAPFKLATSGWVLGPAQDRAAYDRDLPQSIAMSALNRELGTIPVDEGFGRVADREKWAIPWMENDVDDGLAGLQLTAGLMRRDAADALKYRCTGLIGLHWRTEIISPNVSALAQAAWDQSWNTPGEWIVPGQVANYPDAAIAGTPDAPLYRSCRYDLGPIRLRAPAGKYKVTLKFCEPHFKSAGERIFDVKVQGLTVLTNLDIFARVGQFTALDFTYGDVAVSNGEVMVELLARKSLPCISAIAVEGPGFTRRINCGGADYKEWQADGSRSLPVEDLYADWAQANFGLAEVGRLFAAIDGKVPRSLSDGCPNGLLTPVKTPWNEIAPQFTFVDRFEEFRPRVRGAGNLDRFDYWLHLLKYLRSLAQLRCALATPDAAEITRLYADAYRHLLATVNTPGALAMVVNMENHPGWGPAVAKAATQPWPKEYGGEPRLIVPTTRSLANKGESLTLMIIALDKQPAKSVRAKLRPLGSRKWRTVEASHQERAVWQAKLPAGTQDFEYCVEAQTADGQTLRWPATAPAMNQTVVVMP